MLKHYIFWEYRDPISENLGKPFRQRNFNPKLDAWPCTLIIEDVPVEFPEFGCVIWQKPVTLRKCSGKVTWVHGQTTNIQFWIKISLVERFFRIFGIRLFQFPLSFSKLYCAKECTLERSLNHLYICIVLDFISFVDRIFT